MPPGPGDAPVANDILLVQLVRGTLGRAKIHGLP